MRPESKFKKCLLFKKIVNKSNEFGKLNPSEKWTEIGA